MAVGPRKFRVKWLYTKQVKHMSTNSNQAHPIRRLFLRAAKLPFFLLLASVALIAFSYIDDLFIPLTRWRNLFDLTDKIGDIFFTLAIVTFVYSFAVLACRRYEKRLAVSNLVVSLILSSLQKGLRIIFILMTINIVITHIGPTRVSLIFANNIINMVIIAAFGWIAIQILYTTETVLFKKMQTLTHDAQARVKALYTKMHILRNIATVIIIVITTAAILMSFDSVRNVGISLLASAGFLTAIAGLSAQRTLVSLFAGLQIALSQPIKIGDIVVVEKESGLVEEITLTYVTLKLGDRRRLIIPINYFIEKPFENWSHEGHSLRSSLHLYVDFMMPIEPLRQELERILDQSLLWDKVAKKLLVSNVTDRAVEIRIQVSASNPDNLSDLRTEVREKMLSFIQKSYPDHFPSVRLNSLNDMKLE